MAKDRDSDLSGTSSQLKRPPLNHYDSTDSQPHGHHRSRSQKHIVGGGGRLHARVPSSKALHKHHASTTSASKLSRRHGSLSPERAIGPPAASTHRRATSDLKLTRDPSATDLKKNASQTSFKGKRNKSASSLKRSTSQPAVSQLKSAVPGSKVHFNLGDDGQDDDNGPEDEWVDASTSASPLLSRRNSTVNGAGQVANPPTSNDNFPSPSLLARREDKDTAEQVAVNTAHDLAQSLSRDIASHKQYLTSRILQRTPSHGAPPKMSTDNVLVRPSSSHRHSPDLGDDHDGSSSFSATRHLMRTFGPGSSGGKEQMSSRFIRPDSQLPGSETPGNGFLTSATRTGLSRTGVNDKAQAPLPRRPRSMGSLAQARDQLYEDMRRADEPIEDPSLTDEEDLDNLGASGGPRARRRGGAYAIPRDMNRTQQKMNLQRVSSTLEPSHPHPAVRLGLAGVPVDVTPLIGGSTFDAQDPMLGRVLERTGMEYLVVRRYQNPVARSLARLAQLPGMNINRRIPPRPGTGHSRKSSDLGAFLRNTREPEPRDPPSAATTITDAVRRPTTPRRAFSAIGVSSTGSSLENDDGASKIHERQNLSGASLVDGVEDAGTIALLRMMWDKNMDLSASQD
ncbi:hypothetical protein B0H63DRAFT_209806 [Podospora didyma]|uniref:Uncharacterized protein n=1 Tax=Podospora didyma TaxID=330526 RepID=A0AAE0NHJ4_9PEZI|nr:hypothetical protein B0H63DRAFT_209806 [Podospora didyma]